MEKRNEPATTGQSESTRRELVITRIFDAPRELVWKAWTDPDHFKKWWGPKTYSAPSVKMDLKVGGKYLWCMRSREGKDYWVTGTYREIVPPEKLVFTDSFADEKGNIVPASYYEMAGEWDMELLVTVLLEEQDGKTKLILHQVGLPAGEMTNLTHQGWDETFDKLAASIQQ